jgi:K+-sensing histidine kinase KdpD
MLRSRPLAGYAVAVVIVAAAIAVRFATRDVFVGYPFSTILPAVVLATYVAGTGPGLLALVLGGIGGWYFLLPVAHSLTLESASEGIVLGVYLLAGGFVVWVVSALAAATDRERAARRGLARAVEEKDRPCASASCC